MAAYIKIGSIKGEATDQQHKDWVIIESMSSSITRSIPSGARDQQRSRGDTTPHDIAITRQLDASSTKLQEACANGTFFPTVEIHFCTQVKNKQEPYLIYKLSDVIVSSYSISASQDGNPLPHESITLGYSKVEWNYIIVDPKTGDKKGNVPAKYDVGANVS